MTTIENSPSTQNGTSTDSTKRPLSNGTVNGLFSVYDKFKKDREASKSGTITQQDSPSKATVDFKKSTLPSFTQNTTQTTEDSLEDSIPNPGFVSRLQQKRKTLIPWEPKSDNAAKILKSITGITPQYATPLTPRNNNNTSKNITEDDIDMNDTRMVVYTVQSLKDKVLDLANEKEAILSRTLKLQETIEQAHEENALLQTQLKEAQQQRTEATNSTSELKQRLRTMETLLEEQSEELASLRWNLQGMNQQLESSRRERELLMTKAKSMEEKVNQNPPSKQMWDLHLQIEQEKTRKVQWEQYAKNLEVLNAHKKSGVKEVVQLIVLLFLCFSLFGFILHIQHQTRKQLPWEI